MRTCDDEKPVIYLLLLLVRHGQNNYFFGRTKLEKIRYLQKISDVFNFGRLKGPKMITSEFFCVWKFRRPKFSKHYIFIPKFINMRKSRFKLSFFFFVSLIVDENYIVDVMSFFFFIFMRLICYVCLSVSFVIFNISFWFVVFRD